MKNNPEVFWFLHRTERIAEKVNMAHIHIFISKTPITSSFVSKVHRWTLDR